MRKLFFVLGFVLLVCLANLSFRFKTDSTPYNDVYNQMLARLGTSQQHLLQTIKNGGAKNTYLKRINQQIDTCRTSLKAADFWLRYLEPVVYKKLNGPLPVEWETEVFEKFEKPYKREGAGFTLATLYLQTAGWQRDSLKTLVQSATDALATYRADSITGNLQTYHHFFFCNRLFLLNLATIYTTGFECPDTSRIIPELLGMLRSTQIIYKAFNAQYPATALTEPYLQLYNRAIKFVANQPSTYSNFNHFAFIKDYVNPLFKLNQQYLSTYKVFSKSFVDYSLNNSANSIFSKQLYRGQNAKGLFLRVNNSARLSTIAAVGKLLFYDPVLSANNRRSCNSCHNSLQFFTRTNQATPLAYNGKDRLPRNAPSLLNAKYNHLLRLDGKHTSLQHQFREVVSNPAEMAGSEADILQKLSSISFYKQALEQLVQYTPVEPELTLDHVASAITLYLDAFSNYTAPFDDMMNNQQIPQPQVVRGFNLFMSKAQCATCHFAPIFNGVKPPYVSSEFEVLGVPASKKFKKLSADDGRYDVNPATEMKHALRTGTLRNAAHTAPYMHNGVFNTLAEVMDFYDRGGGAGQGLQVPNQTLSANALHLTAKEKSLIITFIKSLNEHIVFEAPPTALPPSADSMVNKRSLLNIY